MVVVTPWRLPDQVTKRHRRKIRILSQRLGFAFKDMKPYSQDQTKWYAGEEDPCHPSAWATNRIAEVIERWLRSRL
jgi:hypothetical protein